MTKPNRIIIVGHMGAGKSLLGKTLAENLGWKHIDTNIGMERYIGRHLTDIIGTQGTDAFYQFQHKLLTHYLSLENLVITTEDSYILNEQNRRLLSSEFVIYLKVPTSVQIERMSDGPAPLLPSTDIKTFLDKLHDERDSLYEEVAKITIESKSIEEDLGMILKSIERN
jgi:shikimate kinase